MAEEGSIFFSFLLHSHQDTQQKKSVSKQINVPVYKDVDANSSKSSNRGMIQNNDSFDISFDSNTEITNTPKFITSIDFNDSIAQKSTNKTQIYQRSNSDRGESSKKTSNPNIENITPKSIKKHGSVSFINSDQLVDLNDEFLSVGQLAPFSQFTIKVRVTRKSDLRSFRQGVGEGKVFTVDVIDKEGCETTVTFFGEAADHFYHIMEENTVYIMRGGNVKLNNSKFGKKYIFIIIDLT